MKLGNLFDGLYTITNTGKLFSHRTNKWLIPATDKYGYLYYVVSIKGDRFTIKPHRAVAQCFIPNPEEKPTVDHINGDRKDNRVENLRWATWKEQQENETTMKRATMAREKTDYSAMGARRNYGRVPVKAISTEGKETIFPTIKMASETLGLQMSKISLCINGKRKTTGGYKFCRV